MLRRPLTVKITDVNTRCSIRSLIMNIIRSNLKGSASMPGKHSQSCKSLKNHTYFISTSYSFISNLVCVFGCKQMIIYAFLQTLLWIKTELWDKLLRRGTSAKHWFEAKHGYQNRPLINSRAMLGHNCIKIATSYIWLLWNAIQKSRV